MIIMTAVSWFLAVALAGWLAFPLAYRLLACLPDRGLALARPLGLLLWGYVYWLLVTLHILQNDAGGVLFALLFVGALSGLSLGRGGWKEIAAWLRANKRLTVNMELVFATAFLFMLAFRAANPDASGTEKPMELAFINAILRSPGFPPADPWLSGYAISYYYFGYVIVAMLARITAVPGAVAFNLALAAWFALTALGAYGLLYNLLSLRGRDSNRSSNLVAGLLAPLLVLIAGNSAGFLEMLHARGIFWTQDQTGAFVSPFWKWLDIQELTQPPSPPFSWQPERTTGIWWWRASRVLQDYALDGSTREVIDEFPMFSFVLGDLHPHVLSMPFVLLSIGLALHVFLMLRSKPSGRIEILTWVRTPDFWAAALILGSLSFLNTWDFPIYLALFAGAAALANLIRNGWKLEIATDLVGLAVSLGLAGGLLYLPFYLSFGSQANGLLPSLVFFTRGAHLWVMFGIFLIPLLFWMGWNLKNHGGWNGLKQGLIFSVGLFAGLWLLSVLYGFFRLQSDPGLAGVWGAQNAGQLLAESITRRFASPGAWLTLLILLALAWGLLQWFLPGTGRNEAAPELEDANTQIKPKSDPFIILLLLLGAGLVIFPEFFYLRDQFGFRMNTIFKFYFQAWIVWAVAASYAVIVLGRALRGVGGVILNAGLTLLVVLSLPYALYGIESRRSHNLQPETLTLDGSDYIARYMPLEMDAIRWLQNAPYGMMAEAVGGSYTGYARISTYTGLPTVLGWPGHESQWRGGVEEMGSRQTDIDQLYRARDWEQASSILNKYQVRYLYVGAAEVRDHRVDMDLFRRFMPVVFQNAEVTIFENPSYLSIREQAEQP